MAIDETATKIIVQYNRKDNKLYGLSAMPCFILVCDITENFDNSSYFAGLKIQYDKKTKSKIIGKFTINSTNRKHIHFGYAQFANYKDWNKATKMESCEIIDAQPTVATLNPQASIDEVFDISRSIGRPRSTYVYSLAVS